MLSELKRWVSKVLAGERLWPIHHIKFVGMNFYLVIFKILEHRMLAVTAKSWFVEFNYMYTFKWDPSFNLSLGGFTPLLVWVYIPYRVLSLEVVRVVMTEFLGEVLVYLNGDHHSSYPNDRMCVLWDLWAITLESVAMRLKDGITI